MMTWRGLQGVAAALAAALPSMTADAADLNALCGQRDPIPGFTAAEISDQPAMRYPREEERNYSEGWVLLEYQISDKGIPGNIAVVDVMGPRNFVNVAIEGVGKWRYKPATRNGDAVEQFLYETSVLFRYRTPSKTADNDGYVTKYNTARRHLREGKYDEAIAVLEDAFRGRLNLYEAAMGSFLLATAYSNKGEWERALSHIGHATIEKEQFLERGMRPHARAMEVELNARTGNFRDAVCLFEQMKKSDPAMTAPDTELSKIMAGVTAAVQDPKPLAMDARLVQNPLIDGPAVWRHRLHRSKFWFADVKGEVKSFRLACLGTFHDASIDAETLWNVPAKAGTCILRVEGAPGATFKLVEEW
jgi:tetratricopeptide (TPR) repeat protein